VQVRITNTILWMNAMASSKPENAILNANGNNPI
jgi:hypothetical protein